MLYMSLGVFCHWFEYLFWILSSSIFQSIYQELATVFVKNSCTGSLITGFSYIISRNFFWCLFAWVEQVACIAGVFFPSSKQFCLMKTIYSSVILGSSLTAVTVTNLTLISLFDNQIFACSWSESVWGVIWFCTFVVSPFKQQIICCSPMQVVNFNVYFID